MDPLSESVSAKKLGAHTSSDANVAKLQFCYSATTDPLTALLKQQQKQEKAPTSERSTSNQRPSETGFSTIRPDAQADNYRLREDELFSYVNPQKTTLTTSVNIQKSQSRSSCFCPTENEVLPTHPSGRNGPNHVTQHPEVSLPSSRMIASASSSQPKLSLQSQSNFRNLNSKGLLTLAQTSADELSALHDTSVPAAVNNADIFGSETRTKIQPVYSFKERETKLRPVLHDVNRRYSTERSDGFHLPPNPPSSTLTAITQNVWEHARDFQAMARSAATSFFTSATASDSSNLDVGGSLAAAVTSFRRNPLAPYDGDETVSNARALDVQNCHIASHAQAQDELWAIYTGRKSLENLLPPILQPVPSCLNSVDQRFSFDSKLPYFGRLHLGWRYECPQLGTRWTIMKCGSCWEVYAARLELETESIFQYRSLIPERLVSRLSTAGALPALKEKQEKLEETLVKKRSDNENETQSVSDSVHLYPQESVLIALGNVVCLWSSAPPIHGQLLATNFRLLFLTSPLNNCFEAVLGTQWMHLSNFGEVPLAAIHKLVNLTLSSKERTQLLYGYQRYWSNLTTDTAGKDNKLAVGAGGKRGHATRNDGCCIEVTTKDMRKIRFLIYESGGREKRAVAVLSKAVFQNALSALYALNVLKYPGIMLAGGENESVSNAGGFSCGEQPPLRDRFVYDPERELMRFLVPHQREWLRISYVNASFAACPTYPKLMIVPKVITDDMLLKIAAFRCKQRFPYLSWASSTTYATLWRSSQPKSMFQRCTEDEVFFATIASSSASHRNSQGLHRLPLLILDARPLINAVVNKASGAGFENTSTHYRGCRIEFASIDNIHHVRQAWKKMAAAVASPINLTETCPTLLRHDLGCNLLNPLDSCSSNPSQRCPYCRRSYLWDLTPKSLTLVCDPAEPQWIYAPSSVALTSSQSTTSSYSTLCQQMAASPWYDYIQRILRSTNLIVSQLRQGEAVIVHCSDGWDRTVQLTSLVMLCIDSYYRTLTGFFTLIEQEFLHGGHQFHTRCGHPGRIIRAQPKQPRGSAFLEPPRVSEAQVDVAEEVPGIPPSTGASLVEGAADDLTTAESDIDSVSQLHHSKQQESPIFIQWLDCVYQLMVQFPTAFEFTTALLDVLAAELYACFYGTFLLDCSKDRELVDLDRRTFSLWSSVLNAQHRFLKKHFVPNQNVFLPPLVPNTHDITVWSSYWFRHRPLGLNYLAQRSFAQL